MRSVPALAAAVAIAACGGSPRPAAPATAATAATAPDDDVAALVRTRCATDGRDTITTWTGTILAYVPGEAPRAVLDVAGVNVARCGHDARGWYLTSRELMLYLDPATGAVLDRWTNPWTGAEVPVVHVANDPVQARLTGAPPRVALGDRTTYAIDVPLAYPNPLAADPALAAYSPAPTYAAIELFTLTAPTADVDDVARPTVSRLDLTWHRVGPWLPWMAQGDRPGVLVYRATGERVASIDALVAPLREALARAPAFASAPPCLVDAPNVTSWTYFAAHADAYRRGARFPIAAPAVDAPCRTVP